VQADLDLAEPAAVGAEDLLPEQPEYLESQFDTCRPGGVAGVGVRWPHVACVDPHRDRWVHPADTGRHAVLVVLSAAWFAHVFEYEC
jgi:hypothetical protein